MKRLLLFVLFWTGLATAQVVGPGFVNYVTSAPSGTCSQGVQQQNVIGLGTVYTCQSGTWTQVGGGGSSVTSVTGTANQITSSGGTTPVLSIPSTFIAPGSIAATTSLASGANGGAAGVLNLLGSTSGTASCTAPAIAGTSTNAVVCTNVLRLPNGAAGSAAVQINSDGSGMFYNVGDNTIHWNLATNDRMRLGASAGAGLELFANESYAWNVATVGSGFSTTDTMVSRGAPGLVTIDSTATGNKAGFVKSAQTLQITGADVTCGTGGTISSCVAMQTITGLTATLPLVAANWSFTCDLILSQATAAVANQIGVQTATNGATNLAASASVPGTAGALTSGAITGVASTTTAQSVLTFTLSGIGTKVPLHLSGTIEGASASGTVFNVTILTGAAADLLTIYRGSSCYVY